MHRGVVIVAAGSSSRMGGWDKTTRPLAGQPSVAWVLDAFDQVDDIQEIVVVTSARNRDTVRALLHRRTRRAPVSICPGGAARQDSVRAGIDKLAPHIELVLIHDAARPLLTPALIRSGFAAGERHGAAVAAVPVADTIKRVGPDDLVRETLDRAELRAVQTPQVFRRDWLNAAYARNETAARSFTDEAGLLEWAGYEVHVFPGAVENLKLTTAIDLIVAETLLARRAESGAP